MNTAPFDPAHRLLGLDGLRAVAILLVLCRHALHPFDTSTGGTPLDQLLFQIFSNGWVGVDLFFILSGVLITRSVLAMQPFSWRLYLAKRMLRILPAYYAALILAAFITAPQYEANPAALWSSLFYHLLLLQDYTGADINVAFWSLGVEEKFYLAMPFLLWATRPWGTKGLAVIAALLVISGPFIRCVGLYLGDLPTNYESFFATARSPFHACLEPLFLGVLIGLWYKPGQAGAHRYLAPGLFYMGLVGLGALLLMGDLVQNITWIDYTLQPSLIAIVLALLVGGVIKGHQPRWLVHPVALWFGRLSFALYLIHLLTIPFAVHLADTAIMALPAELYFPLFLCFYVFLSIGGALVLHFGIERPGLAWKRRVEERARTRSVLAPGPA